MTTETTIEQEPAGGSVGTTTDEQLIALLVDRARGDGLKLTGEGGLLQQLTKRVLESALEGEITDHVGYDKHDPAGKGTGNSRNGTRTKTVLTAGPPACYGAEPEVAESETAVRVRIRVGLLPEAADQECPAIAVESVVLVRLAAPLAGRTVDYLT
ncbi:mutator family transposase [Micromonospora sp. Llam0]|nr:mutator family transposase [Micromonospora sp. Llam0]